MKTSKGITLVEVVFLLLCFGVLLALLLPAIGPPRGGRRNQCVSNLRSIGQATIIHATNQKHFPGYLMDFGTFDGGGDPGIPDADPNALVRHRKIGTWAVALLPYLDQQAVWERWTEDRYPIAFSSDRQWPLSTGESGEGYCALAAPNIPTFVCPNDASADGATGINSYVCNAGFHHASAAGKVTFAESMSAANGVFNNQFAGLGKDGQPVATGPRIGIEDIKDGLSNTLLFSENVNALPWHRAGFFDAKDLVVPEDGSEIRYPDASRFTQGLVWHYEDNLGAGGAGKVNPIHRVNGAAIHTAVADLTMSPSNGADLARPSSFHPGIVHTVFADGANRTITDTIDYRVYQAILTPHGAASNVPDPTFVLTDEIAQ